LVIQAEVLFQVMAQVVLVEGEAVLDKLAEAVIIGEQDQVPNKNPVAVMV
jgi:hypothetical protein